MYYTMTQCCCLKLFFFLILKQSFSYLCSLSSLVGNTAFSLECHCSVPGREDGGWKYELWSMVSNIQGSKDCLKGKRKRMRLYIYMCIYVYLKKENFYLVSSNRRFAFLFLAAGNASGSRAVKL